MKILVTIPFTDTQKEKIVLAAGDNEILFVSKNDVTDEQIGEADIMMGNLPPKKIQKAVNLKWLQLNSAGANQYCVPGVLPEGAILTNATGAYEVTVCEHMMAMVMALLRQLPDYWNNQKECKWNDEGPMTSAYGAKVLIMGLGNIGTGFARRMKAMGSYIIGVKKHIGPIPECVDELHTLDELDKCLNRADIVVNVLPDTPETTGIIGKKQLEIMKKTAYFINAGRGTAIDTDALIEALYAGEIAGAGLDVTDPEPLPSDHPLWKAPRLLLTPHVAGQFHIPVTLEIISDICANNLKKYQANEKLINEIDQKKGY